jgi:hypothetical protein
MKEYLEDGYEVEPFMPGISPVGKATPPTKTVNIPTPYVPYGTGYKYLRSKPGFRKVNNAVRNQIIAEYGLGKPVETERGQGFRSKITLMDILDPKSEPRRRPYLRSETGPAFKQGYKQIPKGMEVTSDIDFYTKHAMGEIFDTLHPPYNGSSSSLGGQYDSVNKVVIVPEKGPDYPKTKIPPRVVTDGIENYATDDSKILTDAELDSRGIRRHEFGHVVDYETGKAVGSQNSPLKAELPARVAETKSIRQGLDKTMNHLPAYEERLISEINRRNIMDIPYDSKWKETVDASMNEKGNFPEAQAKQDILDKQSKPYKIANKVLQKIPSKPGMFTGRVPTFVGIGGNLVDMVMMSPDYQRAKEDPTFGIGEAERERLEAAYQYGL